MSTKEEKLTLLQKIWRRTEKEIDAIKEKRASKSLRVQAESDLLELQDSVVKKEEAFEKAVEEAKENKNWKKIREAKLAHKLEAKKLEEAASLYKEFFNEDPSRFLDE